MTRGEIVEWIGIDFNMGLVVAPQVVIDATKSLLQCTSMNDPNTLTSSTLEPTQFVPWSTLYPIDKVLVPTRLDLGATTFLMILKTLVMMLNTVEKVLKPLSTMENPYIGCRSIFDHYVVMHALMGLWYPRRRFGNPTCDVMMDLDPWRSPCMVEEYHESHWHVKEAS